MKTRYFVNFSAANLEISKMCYKGKCLYCVPVEHGCLVLAIISAVISSLILLASAITDILVLAEDKPTRQNGTTNGDIVNLIGIILGEVLREAFWYTAVIIATLLVVVSLIALVMSVLLCHGIYKRRPTEVMIYFTFGVVVTVLMSTVSVLQLCSSDDKTLGTVELTGCVIYSLFLVLVYHTYTKLRRNLQGPLSCEESRPVADSSNVLIQAHNVNHPDLIYPSLAAEMQMT